MTTIFKPQVIQPSKFEFKISFIYDDQNLETPVLQNSTEPKVTKDIIRALVDDYEARKDKKNLDKIVAFFTGDSVEL